jgi:glycerate dehydrogenase
MKIVVLDGHVTNPDLSAWKIFNDLGDVEIHARTAPSEIVERCTDADAIFTNKVVISEAVMAALPKLKFIGVLATGFNNVDIAAASQRGITVCNVPAYSSDSVAQLVFTYILHITTRVDLYDKSVHEGGWTQCPDFSYTLSAITELAGLTIGIYGLGNIGKRVAAIAHGFGMNVISATSQRGDSIPNYIKKVTFDEMLAQADIITVHCPLTDANRRIFNKDTFAKMSPGAVFINTARGPLVDEGALAEALETHHLAAAAVDVLCQEPPKANCPLLSAPNCIITPHIAWQSVAARERLLKISAENLMAFTNGHPQNVVNH